MQNETQSRAIGALEESTELIPIAVDLLSSIFAGSA
jgi:hypothetical protein